MSEHQADLFTILIVALCMPIVGIDKIKLAQLMRSNTVIRTRIGDWLVKMFVAIGATFILFGVLYALSFAISYQWISIPIWVRWAIRIALVVTALMDTIATRRVVTSVIPLLQENKGFNRLPTREEER